jgi:hypothetical protein
MFSLGANLTHLHILAAPEACISMWRQLCSLHTSSQVLSLEPPGSFLQRDLVEIFIRDSYQKLFEKILCFYNERQAGVLLTGNPGIGKSVFLRFALYCFLELGKVIAFEAAEQNKVYIFKPGEEPKTYSGDLAYLPELEDRATIFLHDPKAGQEPLQADAFTILASSPNPMNYKGFRKQIKVHTLYMPVWKLGELLTCSNSLKSWKLSPETITQRFSVFGGIPRFIEKYDEYYPDLIAAIEFCDTDSLLTTATKPDLFAKFSHKILHYDVSSSFQAKSMTFASDFVFKRLVEQWELKSKQALEIFVFRTTHITSLGSARGKAFEALAHQRLIQVGTIKICCSRRNPCTCF